MQAPASHCKLPALLCAGFLALIPNTARAAARQQLRGHVPPSVAHLPALRRLPATNRLDLVIGLPLRNREALTNLLQQLYDPASPNYRQYLTPQQFAERFGPTEQDYQTAIAFAKSRGLTVTGTSANRTLLQVDGTVRDIEQCLRLNLKVYQHPNELRTFHAPDAEPSLDLSVPILSICGLDDLDLPRPMSLRTSAFNESLEATPFTTGSGPRGYWLGQDFRAAYAPGVSLDGAGQAIGIFALDDFYPSDIRTYEDLAGLPRVPIEVIRVSNRSTNLIGSKNIEVALDIEMAIAMAPGVSKVIVYEGRDINNVTYPNVVLNCMATNNAARQLSCSWGFRINASTVQIYQQFAAQGQTMFQASGDYGAWGGCNPMISPCDIPLATVVGGTLLTTSGQGGAWESETAWSPGGGGSSTNYPIPSWQQPLDMSVNGGSTTNRNIPDVAAVADFIWAVANHGEQGMIGGTSASAPLWAGFAALANQQAALSGKPAIGFINPALYAIGQDSAGASAFHDITTGNNTNACNPAGYFAVSGYDLATGWGTPTGSNLIAALLAPPDVLRITPAANLLASGPAQGPFSPAVQSYSLTNAGGVSLTWALSNTATWLDVSPSGGTLAPGDPAATVTLSPNAAAAGLAPGTYAATLWFTNLNNSFVQNRRFTLAVVTPPLITAEPADLSVIEGMTATFTVGAATNALLFYQWLFNGTNLADGGIVSGSATSTLSLSNVAPANAGAYSVIVSNAAGQALSSGAHLTIASSAPVITVQPLSQTALPGQTVTLSLSAVGSPPLLYLWLKGGTFLTDGGNLSGTGTSTLTLSNVTATNAGAYSAIVVNGLGFALSSNALLAVASVTTPGVDLAFLHSFTGGPDGAQPNGLVQGADGWLYGTALNGGTNSRGTAFRFVPGGGLTTLWSFAGEADGAYPRTPLMQGADGGLYGTALSGGASGQGTLFKLSPAGLLTNLHSFAGSPGEGATPYGALVQSSAGDLYGTTYSGGASGYGTVFKLTSAGSLSTLHSFAGTKTDGSYPIGPLARGPDGNLYGTTYRNGAYAIGTVFQVAGDDALVTVASLDYTNGGFPRSGLIQASDGNFYGTAAFCGAYGYGAVFRMTPGGLLTNLHSFSGTNDGLFPYAALVESTNGNFYGTTTCGGAWDGGTVFRLAPNGTFVTLVEFDGNNGANPEAALVEAADGALYGTTPNGGPDGQGTLFRLGINSCPQITTQPASLAVYSGANVNLSVAVSGTPPLRYQWLKDGTNVAGATARILALTAVTTADAGSYSVIISNDCGVAASSSGWLQVADSPPIITDQPADLALPPGATAVFTVTNTGSEPFSYQWLWLGTNALADGGDVSGAATATLTIRNLVETNGGSYSVLVTNTFGQTISRGALLAVIPPSAAGTRLTTLHWFTDGEDGGSPNGLMQATNGSFYGTAAFGGTANGGTLFQMPPGGPLTTLLAFGWTNGALPAAALTQGADGALYGTTEYGGDYAAGTVFRLQPGGELSMLYSFSGLLDGAGPYAALVQAADGNLYGSTQEGGFYDEGTLFRMTPGGLITTFYAFSGDTNGGLPVAALVQAPDGSFYGTTPNGGSNYCGNVLRMAPDGRLTNLYSFRSDSGSFPPAGNHPVAPLVRGADGAFYGTTKHSTLQGAPLQGTVFRITTNGALTSLYAFNAFNPADGWFPEAAVIQGGDGNFYGTTSGGGVNRLGTVFRVTPAGAMTTLVSFDGFDTGAHPLSALVAGADGSFYGTTTAAGLGGHGTIFRLSFAPQIITQPANQAVLVGNSVTFAVALFGSQPLSYQWLLNGTNLADGPGVSGAASSALTLAAVSLAHAGTYSVVVTNALGAVTSTGAVLTVLAPPVFQTIRHTNASVILTWSAASGATYQLQYKLDLLSADWSNLGAAAVASGDTMTAADPATASSRRFYRVLLLP